MKRGADLRSKFESESEADSSRFLKSVARIQVKNSAEENHKAKTSNIQKVNPQESGAYFTHLPVGWGFSAIP